MLNFGIQVERSLLSFIVILLTPRLAPDRLALGASPRVAADSAASYEFKQWNGAVTFVRRA